jgi:hypothetical protein
MTRGQHRGAFVIEELSGPRFELAMERLRNGQSFELQDVALRLEKTGALVCVVDSSWGIENITLATATNDLRAGEATVDLLLQSSPAFAATVQERPVRYELVEDYGGGSVLICSKVGDVVTWADGVRPKR